MRGCSNVDATACTVLMSWPFHSAGSPSWGVARIRLIMPQTPLEREISGPSLSSHVGEAGVSGAEKLGLRSARYPLASALGGGGGTKLWDGASSRSEK
jgi:hypothetical protein